MTSRLGIGAMIHELSGGSKEDPAKYYGRKIEAVKMDEEQIILDLGFVSIRIWDDGQSCCENRYMSTDDNIQSLVGHTLTRIEAKEGPTEEWDYDYHETVFVEIGTDSGFITIVNHNEHNGYYGGFGLNLEEVLK